jgi:hypothetical protein
MRDSPQRHHMLSRYDYVSNIMRATMPQRHSEEPVPSHFNSSEESADNANEDTAFIKPEFAALFRHARQFQLALDALCYPIPVGFNTKFVLLGFHTLPRQYVF